MTCQAFLESLGLNQVVTGTAADSLAGVANRGITSLAGRYVAATGVASSASGFFASIAPYVTAFTGGFAIGYTGYTLVSGFADWLVDQYSLDTADAPVQCYTFGGYGVTSWEGETFLMGTMESSNSIVAAQEGYSLGTSLPAGTWTFGGTSSDPDVTISVNYTTGSDNRRVANVDFNSRSWSSSRYLGPLISVCLISRVENGRAGFAFIVGPAPGQDVDWDWSSNIVTPYPGITPFSFDGVAVNEAMTITGTSDFDLPVVGENQEYVVDVGVAPDTSLDDLVTMVPEQIADGTIVSTGTVATPGDDTPPTSDVPTINPNPPASEETPEDVKPATVQLGMIFPFCIPFDVYHMVTLLVAEPEAPNGRWEFSLPWEPGSQYVVEWDLEDFDDVAALLRTMELILFAVGLAAITRRYIKW